MLRYNRIPSRYQPAQLVEHTPDRSLDDTRIVDDSKYMPNRAAEQILNKQKAMSILNSFPAFDTPEDIAAGAVNLLARHKGVDLAEISQHADRLKTEIDKQVKLAQRQHQRQQQQNPSERQPEPKEEPKE